MIKIVEIMSLSRKRIEFFISILLKLIFILRITEKNI